MKIFFLSILFLVDLSGQTKLRDIDDLSGSPVETFKNYCSRCHGYEGKAYGKGFAELEDEKLRITIKEMMFGPAQMQPEQIDIEAMYSYNKSLRDNKPFAAAINSESFLDGKDEVLYVSVSPGSEIKVDDNGVKIEKEKDLYKLYFKPVKGKIKINVLGKNSSASFIFPDKIWSE